MLELTIYDGDLEVALQFEHSLISLSKWEQIHETPFFHHPMSKEGTASYIEQMLLNQPPVGDWVEQLEDQHFSAITNYINAKRTATTFRDDPNKRGSKDVITNELIYSWMIRFKIPFDPCETWHLNQLMTLIKVCGIQQTPPKKMTRAQQAAEYRRVNEERRRELGTSG